MPENKCLNEMGRIKQEGKPKIIIIMIIVITNNNNNNNNNDK